MMNRIILIGNGFDLAHGLPTGYCDFIKDYWNTLAHKLFFIRVGGEENDGFMYIKHNLCPNNPFQDWRLESWEEMKEVLKNDKTAQFVCHSPLFEQINQSVARYGWADVENIYYYSLKGILRPTNVYRHYRFLQDLNKDFDLIKDKLIDYLTGVQKKHINSELIKSCIQKIIFEPINVDDISISGRGAFEQWLTERLLSVRDEEDIESFLYNYDDDITRSFCEVSKYLERNLTPEKHKAEVLSKSDSVPDFYLLPDRIMLLNFNYTKTADLYLPENSIFKVNHIHGELGNDNNPIIFGYGDELDEDYKSIANLNDNEYLKNIKSIRYLETDNYRQLLRFIDSAPYQIYVMGHSCGNSDRTLLNTLFEHRNCLSIKPYYHKKADGTDNYIDIVQNISRDFNDMTLMRDRVVNKGYCRPLVEPTH